MVISGYMSQLDVTENYQSMMIICVCVCIYIFTNTTHHSHCSVIPSFASITNKFLPILLQ